MPYAVANGVRLFYEERGEGAPILGIHGMGGSALVWAAAAESLSGLGRVIVYDRRGCARSERPDPYERTSVREQAEDAGALLEALDAVPAILVGRSTGGVIALELALGHPESVRALVLLEADPAGLSAANDAWAAALTEKVESAAAERGVGVVGETFGREVLGDWAALPSELREMLSANGPAILAELRGSFEIERARLERLRAPALLVSGAGSPEPFRQVTDALANALAGARTVLVPGGHLVDPAGPAVLAFVAEVLET